MKNLFFALVFMLIGSFAFANASENFENGSQLNEVSIVKDNFKSNDFTFSINDNQLSQAELVALADCTLRGKFTITFSDGSSYSWEGTLTIVGQSCAEFLKELMKD